MSAQPMSQEDRRFLRTNRTKIIEELLVDFVYPRMTDILNEKDEDEVKAQTTRQNKIIKLLDILPQRGDKSLNCFLIATHHVQEDFANELAQLRGIDLKALVEEYERGNAANAQPSSTSMTADQKNILRENREEFALKLDVERMVASLKEEKILKSESLCQGILGHQLNRERAFALIDILQRLGQKAFHSFFHALKINQAMFFHDIQKSINRKYPGVLQIEDDLIDGLKNMHVEDGSNQAIKQDEPIKVVKDIPPVLKRQLIHHLSGLDESILGNVASATKGERCYVRNGEDFLNKISGCKTRILFRELRKANLPETVTWMREKLPAGSTGPMKSDDEMKPGKMNCGHRMEITKFLNAYKYWEKLAAHEDINMSAVDLALLKQRKDTDHAESVIAGWEVSRKSTVGLLYDLLVDCGLTDLADLL